MLLLVGLGVLFAGVVSSVLAAATTSLLLSFILPVSLAGPITEVPDRLAGCGMASGASVLAIALLWPGPGREPLRDHAIATSRALAARLRADVGYLLGGADGQRAADHQTQVARADAAVKELERVFFATPYRTTGLSRGAPNRGSVSRGYW